MKKTFVQNDEEQAEYRDFFVRRRLLLSDDTPGMVCTKLLNDTPGFVENMQRMCGRKKGLKNLCGA